MRNALYALPIVAAAAFVTPASAQPAYTPYWWPAPWVAGAAVGTTVAIGAYNGWFAGGLAGSSAAAAAVGGTAAIGTVAIVDGILQPCRGFQALFGLNRGACANGQFVGYAPPPAMR